MPLTTIGSDITIHLRRIKQLISALQFSFVPQD